MYATRRLWAGAILVVTLATLAALLERPLLFAGTAVIGAWLLAQQVAFFSELENVTESLSVEQDVDGRAVRTGETTVATLEAALVDPAGVAVSVEGGVPTAATVDDRPACSLAPGETTGTDVASVSWPVAGRHRFSAPTVTVSTPYFAERLSVGPTPEITVEPRRPRHVHVGEGGDRIAAYGSHEGGRFGSGLEPAELREYTTGDTARQIDWKTTARLGTPHVREFETETDRRALLIVDTRSSMADGPPGETKLEYLREVALSIVESARQQDDPVGLLTIDDDDGSYLEPARGPGPYTTVRQRLLDLEGEQSTAVTAPGSDIARSRVDFGGKTALVGDDAFTRTLRPFYDDRGATTASTLPDAIRTTLSRQTRQLSTVVLTDDTRPTELHELVTLARSVGHELTLVLAPSVLYEPGGLADVDRAYERYLEFETLRRELGRLEGVTALEAGPGDRLDSVLAAGRNRGDGHE